MTHFIRKLPVFTVLTLSGLVLALLLWFHPMFRLDPGPTLTELTSSASFDLSSAGEPISDWLQQEQGQRLRENWGLVAPPTRRVDPESFIGWEAIRDHLDEALNHLEKKRYSRALRALDDTYAAYFPELIKGGSYRDDLAGISGQQGRLLYGLIRYNRAVALLHQATHNSKGLVRDPILAQRALFDLRKAVAAFESLGNLPNGAGGDYWGPEPAWIGAYLKTVDGDLALHQVYTNLAVAYLRVGDVDGYPKFKAGYLSREMNKYNKGDVAGLSATVNQVLKACLKEGEQVPQRFSRLAQALHNMEAASQGMGSGDPHEALFYYTIGVLLNHLRVFQSSGLGWGDASLYFEKAMRASKPDNRIHHLARKENALLLLAENRWQEAMRQLDGVDVGATEDAVHGPDREFALLFTDLAWLSRLAKGEPDLFLSHLEKRQHTIKDDTVMLAHDALVRLITDAWFESLSSALRQYNAAEIGSFLYEMEHDPELARIPAVKDAFNRCINDLTRFPSVALNLGMRIGAGLRTVVWVARFLLPALWVLYLLWVFNSHRKVARRLLVSGYRQA